MTYSDKLKELSALAVSVNKADLKFKYAAGELISIKIAERTYKNPCKAYAHVGADIRKQCGVTYGLQYYENAYRLYQAFSKGQIGVLIRYACSLHYALWVSKQGDKDKIVQDIISGSIKYPFIAPNVRQTKAGVQGTDIDHGISNDPYYIEGRAIRDHEGLIEDNIVNLIRSLYTQAPEIVEREVEALRRRVRA